MGFRINSLAVSVIVTHILLTVLLVLSVVWRAQRALEIKARTLATEQTVCGPCSVPWIDGSLPPGCYVQSQSDKNGQCCCCKAGLFIDTLVKKSAETIFGEFRPRATAVVLNSGCVNERKIIGKVAGISYERLEEETREKDLVYWVKSAESYLDSVRYTNGRFYISIPGFYYVFSQIRYDHDPESVNDTDARQSHSLYKYSFKQGAKEKLLENTRTFAELYSSANNGTSFIGAVFKFEKDDEIMIKSSHTHKISGDDIENFFSLYVV